MHSCTNTEYLRLTFLIFSMCKLFRKNLGSLRNTSLEWHNLYISASTARRFSFVYVLFVNMMCQGLHWASSSVDQKNPGIYNKVPILFRVTVSRNWCHFSSPNSLYLLTDFWMLSTIRRDVCYQPLGGMFALSQYTEVPVTTSKSFSSFMPILPPCHANLTSVTIVETNKRFHNCQYSQERMHSLSK